MHALLHYTYCNYLPRVGAKQIPRFDKQACLAEVTSIGSSPRRILVGYITTRVLHRMANNHTISQPRSYNILLFTAAALLPFILLFSNFNIFNMSSSEIKNVVIIGVSYPTWTSIPTLRGYHSPTLCITLTTSPGRRQPRPNNSQDPPRRIKLRHHSPIPRKQQIHIPIWSQSRQG